MLGKLIKHEFRATGRIMLPMFAIMLLVSALANISIANLDRVNNRILGVIMMIIVVVFAIGLIAMAIVSIVLMINRFRSNILGDEGYITFTLPVSVHSLLWSKIIVTTVWFLLTILVIVLCGIAAAFRNSFIGEIINFIKYVVNSFDLHLAIKKGSVLAEFVLMFVLLAASFCLSIYAALSIGHGFANHKMLLSNVSFFVLMFLMSMLSTLSGSSFTDVLLDVNLDDPMNVFHLEMLFINLYIAIHGAIYYVITVLNLKYRLNLE
jgi:hypothetical protein